MNLRWLFGNFTDPQYKLSRREQSRVTTLAHSKYLGRGDLALRTALIVTPLLVLFVLLKPTLQMLGCAGSVPFTIGTAALVLLSWPWGAWMYRSLYVQPIRRAMRDVGYDLCIWCGYEHRGLGEEVHRCPECGAERESLKAADGALRELRSWHCPDCGNDPRGALKGSTRCPEGGFRAPVDLPRLDSRD
jgi:predicted Zn-ribbon and HTH transcriptional regulator